MFQRYEKMKKNTGIAERFKQIRKKLGYSQRELAQAIGFSTSIISEIERGTNDPSRNVLLAMHETLNIDLHWLLLGEGEMNTVNMITKQDKEIEKLENQIAVMDEKIQELENENKELSTELMDKMRQIITLQTAKLT